MSQNILTEVQIMALEEVMGQVEQEHLHALDSGSKKFRDEAYKRIRTLLNTCTKDKVLDVGAFPLFLAQSGNTLSAVKYALSFIENEGNIPSEELLTLLRVVYANYEKVFQSIEKIKKEAEEIPELGNEAVARSERLEQVKSVTSELLSVSGLAGINDLYAQAEYAHRVEKNFQKAIGLYKRILDDTPATNDDTVFLVLGDLLTQVGNFAEAHTYYELGFHATSSIRLFEKAVRVGIVMEGEEAMRVFFLKHKPREYLLPFSYLRGKIISEAEISDIENVLVVFFDSGKSDEGMSKYIQQVSLFLNRFIESIAMKMQELDSPSTEMNPKFLREMRNSYSELYLELLEYQIFYLLEFKHLELYMKIIGDHSRSRKGQLFLTTYFQNHTLSPLSKYLSENDEKEESGVKPNLSPFYDRALSRFDDTPSEFFLSQMQEETSSDDKEGGDISYVIHPFAAVGMRSEILRRYTYIELRISSLDPYSDERIGYDRVMILSSFRAELLTISSQLDALFPDKDYGYSPFVFEGKVQAEEKRLTQAGPEASSDYHEIFEIIDEKFSITERRFLAHQARIDSYTDESLPPLCQRDPLLALFFISERLIAGYGALFGEKLIDVIRDYRLHELLLNHALTFTEILAANGFYNEAFIFLTRFENALDDVDALFILINILQHMGEGSSEYEAAREALEQQSIREYGANSFGDILLNLYQFQKKGLNQGDIDSPEEKELQKKGVAIMAYALGVYTRDLNPEESDTYIQEAIGLGLSEAIHYRALHDLENPKTDTENVLFGLVEAFPDAQFPLRGQFPETILSLSRENSMPDLIQRYRQIAEIEGIDIGSVLISSMFDERDARYALYTFFFSGNFPNDFLEEELKRFQHVLHTDIRSSHTPLHIRILASRIKSEIASHKEYGYLPACFEECMFMAESMKYIGHPSFRETYVSLVKEMFPEFDESGPREYVFINALHFHALKLSTTIRSFIANNPDGRLQNVGLSYYTFFVDYVVAIFVGLPEAHTVSMNILNEEKKRYSLSIMDYWTQEQQRNHQALYPQHAAFTQNPKNPHVFPIHSRIQ